MIPTINLRYHISRNVVFLTDDPANGGQVIVQYAEDGSVSAYSSVRTYGLTVAPDDAEYMLVSYDSTYDGSDGTGGTVTDAGLYILDDTTVSDQYDAWRTKQFGANKVEVTRNRTLKTGSTGYNTNSSANYEATGLIEVDEGDLYLINNVARYVVMYDSKGNFVRSTYAADRTYNYLVIPEGVKYIALDNNRTGTSAAADRSLLNGYSYNQGGCYTIVFLKCGNLESAYTTNLLGANLTGGGSTTDLMYANLRIQLSDGEDNSFTNYGTQSGTYWLEVYAADWKESDDEISDEELEAGGCVKIDGGTIHLIDGESEVVNVCQAIAVKKGKSYKVVLKASVGSRSDVEVGKVYFTVREDDSDGSVRPVYGLSSAFQIPAIRTDNYGDYVLNRDLTMTTDLPANGGTLYGVLDLQGHTLTNSRLANLFDNIGSAAKKQGTIKNGTIAFESTRSGNSMARLTSTNYGTLENLNFKVNNENPSSGSGSSKTYDNSKWNLQIYTYLIYNNRGTMRAFTIEYQADLVSCYFAGFVRYNYGTIENGYIYGDGSVMGGSYVGGLVIQNTSSGTVQAIYSTIDSKSNSNGDLGGSITKTAYNGTIIGLNQGKATGLLATGNVYQYVASKSTTTGYTFSNESVYTTYGCAVGRTTTRMDTTECYYATVGTNKRNDYSTTSYNERVEGGILVDADWFRTLFGDGNLDEEYLETLLSGGYYPWVDMGNAAEKYSIHQPYLTLDVTSSSSFDLVKSEVLEYIFDEDGFAYARVKFTFTNPSAYTVSSISILGLICSDPEEQGMNDDTGFYEVTATIQVQDGGDYVSGYNVTRVYYKRSATGGNSSVSYSYGNYTSTNGERVVDAEFYYPLKNTQEWTELFTSENSDWNFRIWGDTWDDAKDWDFSETYYDESVGYYRWPDSVKTFAYTGNLDGTWYTEQEDGTWAAATDDTGAVKCHVLSNLCDYLIHYKSDGTVSSYNVYGYVFQSVSGSITNLCFEDLSVGVQRANHANAGSMTSSQLSSGATVETTWGELNQTTTTSSYIGMVGTLKSYASLSNVHLTGGYVGPYRSGTEYIGGLVGYAESYCTFTDCSATELTLVTSTYSGTLAAGGLVGYGNSYASFENCYAAKLTMDAVASSHASHASQGVGGLVGYASAVSMTDCYTSGTMTSQVSSTGGLAGRTLSLSEISASYSAMNLSLNSSNGAGLVGYNTGELTVERCLYTGALSAASQSTTIHMLVGYNTSAVTLDTCYTYQPQMSETDSLLDDGVALVTYATLTTDASFYQSLFDDDYYYSWDSYGITESAGAYLPALKDSDGGLLYGQVYDGTCYVPTVPEEELMIADVWAFASEDRSALAALENTMVSTSGAWYQNIDADFYTPLANLGYSKYEPNDVEFTLVLGSGTRAYEVKSIEVEGLASGGLITTNFNDDSGKFASSMLGVQTYRCDITTTTYTEDNTEYTAYRVRLLGTEVVSYRDTYNIIVTLKDGTVLKQTFQFRNSSGDEEAKYLKISNAYEWNLYLGSSGEILTAAESADSGSLLSEYTENNGWKYYGYGASSMNLEIAGDIDFSLLTAISETPYTNVMANNVRGTSSTGDDGSTVTDVTIKNLSVTAVKTTYGLFRTIAGSLTDLNFENITIAWKSENSNAYASSNSGLVGTLSGGMSNVTFTDVTLTGGGSYFGILGAADGVLKDVVLDTVFVESDYDYVGGVAGVLRGDLDGLSLTDVDVSGRSYVGAGAGQIYSNEHDTNGHQIIGGTDRTSDSGTDTEYVGWYQGFDGDDSDYYYASGADHYRYDSLSYDYALVNDVTADGVTVTAMRQYAGGLIGSVEYTKSTTMGYGYMILQDVTATDVTVAAVRQSGSDNAMAGGLVGQTRAVMGHNLKLTNIYVDGNEGSFVGGMFGYMAPANNYDYSAYGDSGERVTYFLSVLDTVNATDITVTGGAGSRTGTTADEIQAYVGGLYGRCNNTVNAHAVTVSDVAVYGSGSYVGGLVGRMYYYYNDYYSDLNATNIQVYNEGASAVSLYTGGLSGYHGYFMRANVSDVQVIARGTSTYVGGLTGNAGDLLEASTSLTDLDTPTYTVTDVQVYGDSYVGGLTGTGMSLRYLKAANITVTGTGDYVGGLAGYGSGALKYVSASKIDVVGRGAAVGGVVGRRTGGTTANCDFSDITVRAGASGVSSAEAYVGATATTINKGSAVGGLFGASSNASISYISVEDVDVYGYDDYVGGLMGIQYGGGISYVSADDLTVYSATGDYVGGAVGYLSSNSSMTRTVLSDASVNAVAGSYAGGFAGYLTPASGNTTTIAYNQVQATINAGGDYAGGLVGRTDDVRYFYNNNVEATVTAGGSYAGGSIGYLHRSDTNLQFSRSQTVAKVTAKDYAGGTVGYADLLLGTKYYYCVTAADVTTTETSGNASWFYTCSDGSTTYSDVNGTSGYPYRLYLWESSTLTKGTGQTPVAANETKFVSNSSDWNGKVAGYWRGTSSTNTKSTNGNQLSLVTTADLENTELYYGGTDPLSYTIYAEDSRSGSTVTYNDMSTMIATDAVWNLYGLDANMTAKAKTDTSSEDVYFLPSPINPLLLNETIARDVSGTDVYNGYLGGGYLIGSATADTSSNTVTYSIVKGIAVPGTTGSILSATTTATAGTLADVSFKSAPKIYASTAYSLNVEFSSSDTYEGAVISVYTASGYKEENAVPELELTATSSSLTYSMYYDFQTDLVIEISNGTVLGVNGEYAPVTGREVLYTIETSADSVSRKVALSSSYLYAIGTDGKIYQYLTSWSKDSEETTVSKSLTEGEVFINMIQNGANITALTDLGRILSVSGSDSNAGKTLSVTVGAADSSSFVDSTGMEETTGTMTASVLCHDLRSQHNLVASTDISGLYTSSEPDEETEVSESEESGASATAVESLDDESESGSDTWFDESLLDAEPLYEFDYGDYHICTYLTYSLIFDGDDVTVRNMQLFVKNDQLFALNAPDEVVPGSVLIDTYQGNTYMTVLRNDGQMVDLMDEINYPDDFVNRNIRNISCNLYSDLTYVQVEYEDGSIVTFNYLTGGVVYEQEGDGEGSDETDFWSFLTGFFRDKLDTAYADVTNAYQNALTMKDYLSSLSWRDWFTSDDGSEEYVDGDGEETGITLAEAEESAVDAETVEGEGVSAEIAQSETSLTSGTGEGVTDGSGQTAAGTDDEEESEEALGAAEESDGAESQILGGGILKEDDESVMTVESGTEETGTSGTGAASAGTGSNSDAETAESESSSDTVGGGEAQTTGAEAGETEAEAETSEGVLTGETGETEDGAKSSGKSESAAGILEDELIIAYDADADGYAVYSTADLLNSSSETLTSVDQQLEEYLSSGGEAVTSEAQILSLKVDSTQRSGLAILGVVGCAIAVMLALLAMQKYQRRRSGRKK